MLKLYLRADGVFRYHEAWVNEGKLFEHWGVVGERGETREHLAPKRKSHDALVLNMLKPAMASGYRPLTTEQHSMLLIEYDIGEGFGSENVLQKRHALEDRMNETLGWTGLGHCDGGSIGSGTMEVCCVVVDAAVARHVIEADLKGTEFSGYSRIYVEE